MIFIDYNVNLIIVEKLINMCKFYWKNFWLFFILLYFGNLVGVMIVEYKDFVLELKILIYVGEYKNIVNFLGVCIKGDWLFIIMEFVLYGNFLKFLWKKWDIYELIWEIIINNFDVELIISNLVVYVY